MRLTPSDPDIETLIGRITSKGIDLQPEFQRGEIWSMQKKQRLIDSILRDWHVPPIHVIVETDTNRQLVLDGQQRLVAIRDFAKGLFSIDGLLEPYSSDIKALHGKRYLDLPTEWKNRFGQFTIRVFRITDYTPSEPGELFYRLNQPTALTSAEQRNAFFGETRKQIKELVELLQKHGLGEQFWGFSNVRMAYDDVLSRVALYIEQGTIRKKVTAASLADQFRSGKPFSPQTTAVLRTAIALLGEANSHTQRHPVRLNKATAQSWLLFVASAIQECGQLLTGPMIGDFMYRFECDRTASSLGFSDLTEGEVLSDSQLSAIFGAYDDRSTSRVADVSSVQIRDLALWISFIVRIKSKFFPQVEFVRRDLKMLERLLYEAMKHDYTLDPEALIIDFAWGEQL